MQVAERAAEQDHQAALADAERGQVAREVTDDGAGAQSRVRRGQPRRGPAREQGVDVEQRQTPGAPRAGERVEEHRHLASRPGPQLDHLVRGRLRREGIGQARQQRFLRPRLVVLGQPRDRLEEIAPPVVVEELAGQGPGPAGEAGTHLGREPRKRRRGGGQVAPRGEGGGHEGLRCGGDSLETPAPPGGFP
jgi:hypothetical protein